MVHVSTAFKTFQGGEEHFIASIARVIVVVFVIYFNAYGRGEVSMDLPKLFLAFVDDSGTLCLRFLSQDLNAWLDAGVDAIFGESRVALKFGSVLCGEDGMGILSI